MLLVDAAHSASTRTMLDLCVLRVQPELLLLVFPGLMLWVLQAFLLIWEGTEGIGNILESACWRRLGWSGMEWSARMNELRCVEVAVIREDAESTGNILDVCTGNLPLLFFDIIIGGTFWPFVVSYPIPGILRAHTPYQEYCEYS